MLDRISGLDDMGLVCFQAQRPSAWLRVEPK